MLTGYFRDKIPLLKEVKLENLFGATCAIILFVIARYCKLYSVRNSYTRKL